MSSRTSITAVEPDVDQKFEQDGNSKDLESASPDLATNLPLQLELIDQTNLLPGRQVVLVFVGLSLAAMIAFL